jgi:hypothetical protein
MYLLETSKFDVEKMFCLHFIVKIQTRASLKKRAKLDWRIEFSKVSSFFI